MGDMFNVLIGKNLASGSGSGGGSATIDTLWSDSNGAAVGTQYQLTSNINSYDIIYLKLGNRNDISSTNSYTQYSFLPSLTEEGEDTAVECFYFMRNLHVSFNGDKFTVTTSGSPNENSGYTPVLWQIVGIKLGAGTSNNTGTGIKTLTYTGDGLATTTITFPETPTVILSIDGPGVGTGMVNLASFRFGAKAVSGSWSDTEATGTKANDIYLLADTNNNTLLLSGGQNVGSRCNVQGASYTVTYI